MSFFAPGLRTKGIPLPPLPTEVRWSSHYKAFNYFNTHWAGLVEVAASLLRPGDPVRRDIENLAVRRASEDLVLQLMPVCSLVAWWGSSLPYCKGGHCPGYGSKQ